VTSVGAPRTLNPALRLEGLAVRRTGPPGAGALGVGRLWPLRHAAPLCQVFVGRVFAGRFVDGRRVRIIIWA
jgi:hypothetical protein